MKQLILFFALLLPLSGITQCWVKTDNKPVRTSEECSLEFFDTEKVYFTLDGQSYSVEIILFNKSSDLPEISLKGNPGEVCYLNYDKELKVATFDFGNGTKLGFFKKRDSEIAKVIISYKLIELTYRDLLIEEQIGKQLDQPIKKRF